MKSMERKLIRKVTKAMTDFGMVQDGDKVMVCMSGGKDSYTLLTMLQKVQQRAPVDFSLVAVNLDQGQPGFPKHILPEYLASQGVPYRIVEKDTYSIVMEKIPEGKTYCSLCSRLRRGILYSTAKEIGATKIALGHHRDDITETLLLNLFYTGQLKAMPPILRSDDGQNTVIRPLAYCPEEEIVQYAKRMDYPIIPCDLCGSQDNLYRQKVKALIAQLADDNATVPGNLFAALRNVRVTHLFDRELWDKCGIDLAHGGTAGLDLADDVPDDDRKPSSWSAPVPLEALRLAKPSV
jgi:tRNA 2-thiocytidine biosynthesis protein TtcA